MDEEDISQSKKNIEIGDNLDDISIDELVNYINILKKEIDRVEDVINEKSKELIEKGKKVYSFGFGQSPFPVPEKIVQKLKENAHRKDYLPIQGLIELRNAISKYLLKKTGIYYPKENIHITPGSKEAMLLMHVAFNGHIIFKSISKLKISKNLLSQIIKTILKNKLQN